LVPADSATTRYSPFFGCRTVESIHREHLGAPLDSDSHPLVPGRQVTLSNATQGRHLVAKLECMQVAAKRDTCQASSRLRAKSHLPGKWTQIRLLDNCWEQPLYQTKTLIPTNSACIRELPNVTRKQHGFESYPLCQPFPYTAFRYRPAISRL